MNPAPASGAVSARAEALRADLRERAFRGGRGPDGIGVEVELIPVDADTGCVLPVDAPDGPTSTLGFLASRGERLGWRPTRSPVGVPGFELPGGGVLTLEPGGQIEFSTRIRASVDALEDRLDVVVPPLVRAGADVGIGFVCRGLDPENPAGGARLQLDGERYRRMAAHYDRRGPWGRRMMRQSAAIHVNLDLGERPGERWAVANAAVPVWTALFANSPRAEGRDTGHRSTRAAQWRRLDPSRTGLFPPSPDPVGAYLDFALGADAFLLGPEGIPAEPFGHWMRRGVTEPAAWRAHLSTLFPEVRPRGYLELRCFDAQHPRWYAAPLVLTTGLLYDQAALREAATLLPDPTPHLLEVAGREGLADPALADVARDLAGLALDGARRLGATVGGRSLERTRAFVDELTSRGRDPGHEPTDRA